MIQNKVKKYFFIVAIFIPIFILINHNSAANTLVKQNDFLATPIKTNLNLYKIDDNLFRSKQLKRDDYDVLKALNIKSIVNLRFFGRGKDKDVFKGKDIKIINVPMVTWNIKPHKVAMALFEIEKAKMNGPVLVHCYHGSDRTGLVSAVYRIVYQEWSLEEAKKELIEGPYGFHSIWKNIENFFTDENIKLVKEELEKFRNSSNVK